MCIARLEKPISGAIRQLQVSVLAITLSTLDEIFQASTFWNAQPMLRKLKLTAVTSVERKSAPTGIARLEKPISGAIRQLQVSVLAITLSTLDEIFQASTFWNAQPILRKLKLTAATSVEPKSAPTGIAPLEKPISGAIRQF